MKRLILAVLLAALCAGRAPALTREDVYWRLHRERNATTRYGAPPTAATNSIPAGYRLLEYVESTAEQYVDTGVHVGPGSRSETDVAVLDWDASTYALSGTTRTDSRHSFGKGYSGRSTGSGNATKLYFGLGAQNYTANVSLSSLAGVRHVYWVDAPSFKAGFDERSFSLTATGDIGVNPTTSLLLAQSVGSNVRGWMAARLYGCRYYENGVRVRDYIPVADANGVAGLWDRVSGTMFYSATSTPLVAGPELRPATVLPTVSRDSVREMLAPAPTGEPPELAGGDLWLDCLAIPEGTWLCECPIDGTTNTAWRAALCPSNILRAVVWRHATGIAPTNLPVTLEHDSSRVIGRIERLYYEAGTGVVARISITQAGFDWARSNRCDRPSPDVRATYTNLIVRSDGWRYEHQDYLDEVVVPMLRDYGTRPEHAAELASFANLTNVPASTPCLVMAPIYLRGLSLVRLPMLPTLIEYRVPDHLRDAYPIRPPRQWDWRR